MHSRGTFIVLDGPDGSGTTTHSKLLADALRAKGYDVLETREPSEGPIGTWIRTLLKSKDFSGALALQLLFCADRAWHIENIIKPALADGKTVICDRYAPSTIAYASAQNIDIQTLKELNNNFIRPDRIIFALPPLEECMRRLGRRHEQDMFETEELQRAIHAEYRRMAKEDPSIRVVDTSGEKKDVAEMIEKIALQKTV